MHPFTSDRTLGDRATTLRRVLGGRQRELEVLDAVVAAATVGNGGAVLVEGRPGIGKTALIDTILRRAETGGTSGPAGRVPIRIVRVAGSEAEQSMSFAGVTQLVAALVDSIPLVAAPQAARLRGILGHGSEPSSATTADTSGGTGGTGGTGEIMTMGLAVLALVGEAGSQRPLLVALDDAHWLDPSSRHVFAFVARRLAGMSVALVAAQRPTVDGLTLHPVLELGELTPDAAVALLTERGMAPFVARAVARQAAGLPLLLTRIAATLTEDQRSGLTPLPDPLPAGTDLEAGYAAVAEQLTDAERKAVLLLAALGDHHDLVTLDPLAAKHLDAAEEAGLVVVDLDGVRFVHPLARSGVYWAATPRQRRFAHDHLANLLGLGEPAAVWHRAAAATGRDDDLARSLMSTGHRSWQDGGAASAVVAFQRAAELAASTPIRAEALVAGARASLDSGSNRAAELLCTQAEDLGADPLALRSVLAEIAERQGRLVDSRDHRGELADLLLEAGRSRDADAAALTAAALSLRMFDLPACERWLRLISLIPDDAVSRHGRILQTALAVRSDRPELAAELPRLIEAVIEAEPTRSDLRFLAETVCFVLAWLGRWKELSAFTDRLHRQAATIVPDVVPSLLLARTTYLVRRDLPAVAADATQAAELAAELGLGGVRTIAMPYLATALAGLGDRQLFQVVEECERGGSEPELVAARMSVGYYHLTHEEWEAAYESLASLHDWAGGELRSGIYWQADLAEAALRTGRREMAERQCELLGELRARAAMPWTVASHLRVQGQLATDLDEADQLFAAAIPSFEQGDFAIARARALLIWGERLRRGRRRAAARERLLEARQGFDRCGMAVWVARCNRELAAAGAPPPEEPHLAHGVLTPQELQVARWIVAGESNREVAERLFISPRTVEAHLSTIYRKLGVRGRGELSALAHRDISLVG